LKRKTLLFSFTAAAALGVLCFFSCQPELEEEDITVSKITIYNIPDKIPVAGKPLTQNETYKIYLSASDSMDDTVPHQTQTTGFVRNGTFDAASGTWSITLDLRKPMPGHDGDPDENNGGPWSGTANYFSVVITPKDVSEDGKDSIWIKASQKPLNIDMKDCDWEVLDTDFRAMAPGVANMLDIPTKIRRLYEDIVLKDVDDITR
jgi:hypothetical protein